MRYVTDDGQFFDNMNDALDHEKTYKKKIDDKKKRRDEVAKAYDDYLALKEKYDKELNQKYDDYLKIKRAYEKDYKKSSEADIGVDFYDFVRSLL